MISISMEKRTCNKNKSVNTSIGGSRLRNNAEKLGAVLIALLFWQLAAKHIDSSILMATPVEVLKRLTTIWRDDGFVEVILFTLTRISLGYLLAVAAGLLAAFAANAYRAIEVLLSPWVAAFRAVPVASMIVILLIWVSAVNLSVIVAFLVVFPVVYTNMLAGLKARSTALWEMAKVFTMSRGKYLRYVLLPQLKPYMLSACSVTAGMAWKAGVAAEVIGTPPRSVGKMIYQSKIWLNTADLFAWTMILVLLSVIFEKLFITLLKMLLKVDKQT